MDQLINRTPINCVNSSSISYLESSPSTTRTICYNSRYPSLDNTLISLSKDQVQQLLYRPSSARDNYSCSPNLYKSRKYNSQNCTDPNHYTTNPFCDNSKYSVNNSTNLPNLHSIYFYRISPDQQQHLNHLKNSVLSSPNKFIYNCSNSYTPQQKQRSYTTQLGISIYRIGLAMYHSSIAVNLIEWHFWEGVGVEPLLRYFDESQEAYVSIDHVPLLEYVPIECIEKSPEEIAAICVQLGEKLYSADTYDILKCNCNHFTAAVLQKLGFESKMPSWINRLANTTDNICTMLPFVRNWINILLNRKTIMLHPTLVNPETTNQTYSDCSTDTEGNPEFSKKKYKFKQSFEPKYLIDERSFTTDLSPLRTKHKLTDSPPYYFAHTIVHG